MRRPLLSVKQILQWADAFYSAMRRWPRRTDGRIAGSLGETWLAIDLALKNTGRGLSFRSTLARLLQEQRGARNRGNLPKLDLSLILKWADSHHRRRGRWPKANSGNVHEGNGETWSAINHTLSSGNRGLPGRSSLAKLLYVERGVRSANNMPRLTEHMIVQWAKEHHKVTGRWPHPKTGTVLGFPSETWDRINTCLVQGNRGLPEGSSLAQLLNSNLGIRNRKALPSITINQIVKWADRHFKSHGRWPTHLSGAIPDSGGETWSGIHAALSKGQRGYPGRSSLFRVLSKYRGVAKYRRGTRLSVSA